MAKKYLRVGQNGLRRADSWHQTGAGGSNVVCHLSASQEHQLLTGVVPGGMWGMNPELLWEAAECGALDDLMGDG